MAKKVKKNYYAIKKAGNVENKIVTTWEECKAIVHGCHATYKGFEKKEDALLYLNVNNTTTNLIEQHIEEVSLSKPKKKVSKSKKASTTAITGIRVPKDTHKQFLLECKRLDIEPQKIICNLIIEWLEE